METKLKPLRKVGRASLLHLLEHKVDKPMLSFAAVTQTWCSGFFYGED